MPVSRETGSALDNETLIRKACDAQADLERALHSAVTAAHDGTAVPARLAVALDTYEEARLDLAARTNASPTTSVAEMIVVVENSRLAALKAFAELSANGVSDLWFDPFRKRAVGLLAAHESGKAPEPAVEDFFAALIEIHHDADLGEVDEDLVKRLRDSAEPEYQTGVAMAAIGRLPLSTSLPGREPSKLVVIDQAPTGLSGDVECSAEAAHDVDPVPDPITEAAEATEPGDMNRAAEAEQTTGSVSTQESSDVPAEAVASEGDILSPRDGSAEDGWAEVSRITEAQAPESADQTGDPCGSDAPEAESDEQAPEPSLTAREKSAPEAVSDQATNALLELICAGRFGLASHIALSLAMPLGLARALEFAALATGLGSSTGALAAQVRERAEEMVTPEQDSPESVPPTSTSNDVAKLDRAAGLIACGAALHVAAVAPHLGASFVLNKCRSSIGESPELQRLSTVVQQLSEKGISITHDLVGQRTDAAQLEMQLEELRRQAQAHIENPGTIKFARATSLWRIMVQSQEHELARALRAVYEDAAAARDDALATVVKLRNRKSLEAVIDDLDRSKMRPSVNRRIDGVARESLRVRILEVVELVEQWINVTEMIERLRLSQESAWLRQASEELTSAAADVRDAELSDWPGGEDRLVQAGASVLKQAAGGIVAMVFDGPWEAGPESPPEVLLGAELLRDVEIRLDPTLEPNGPVPLDRLLNLTSEPDWRDAFERRADRQDHDLLPAIIELMRIEDPTSVISYEERCDHLLNEARRGYERLHLAVGARLSSAYQRGALQPDQWQKWDMERERLTLRDGDLAVGRKLDALKELERESSIEADEAAKRRAQELWSRVPASIAPAFRERLDLALSTGDIATAEEVLLSIERGETLSDHVRPEWMLEQWYPTVSNELSSMRDVKAVAERVISGESVGGISAVLDEEHAKVVRAAFDAWDGLRSADYSTVISSLSSVMLMVGMEITRCSKARPSSTRDFRLYDIVARPVGDPLVPHFGSKAKGHYHVIITDADVTPDRLMAHLEDHEVASARIVLHMGVLTPRQRQAFADLARTTSSSFQAMLVDLATLVAVAALDPGLFTGLERAALPFTGLNPYDPWVSGQVPPEIFYGRDEQLNDLLSADGMLAFIYGGRRLGKSALLRAAEREARRNKDILVHYIDLGNHGVGQWSGPETLLEIIEQQLGETPSHKGPRGMAKPKAEQKLSKQVKQMLVRNERRRILLLLDECDSFIAADAKKNFPTMTALRHLQEETNRRFRPVFAGLHNVRRFDRVSNQRFVHFGRSESVGPLGPTDARNLIERPLEVLGYRLEERSIHRLLTLTQHQPSLIQLVCSELVKHMLSKARLPNTPPYKVRHQDVEQVLALPALAREIAARFELTISLDPRYRLIALVVAYLAAERDMAPSFAIPEIKAHCEEFWPAGFVETDFTGFASLLDEMTALGVLYEDADAGLYSLRNPHIARMLGTQKQIEDRLLESAAEERLEQMFDGSSYRYELPSRGGRAEGRRSPLTLRQTEEMMRHVSALQVIIGSTATGAEAIEDALGAIADRADGCEYVPIEETIANEAARKRFMRALKRQSDSHRIVLIRVGGGDSNTLRRHIGTARKTLEQRGLDGEGSVCGVMVVDEASVTPWRGVQQRWIELSGRSPARITHLRRWGADELRAWLLDRPSDLPAVLEDDIQQLLEVTGGWPMLVEEFVTSLKRHKRLQVELSNARKRLEDPEAAAAFVAATGVRGDAEVQHAFERLIEYGEPLVPEDGMVSTLATICDRAPVVAESVFNVLTALQLVEVDPAGSICCEPVLATAWSSAA